MHKCYVILTSSVSLFKKAKRKKTNLTNTKGRGVELVI